MDNAKKYFYSYCFFIILNILIGAVGIYWREISLTTLILFPFAVSMLSRAVGYLDIFSWLRSPFTQVVKHSCGVGEEVEPKPGPFNQVFGGLLCCLNCNSVWISLFLTILLVALPSWGTAMIYILAISTLGLLVSRLIELLEWNRHLCQETTGLTSQKIKKD